MMAVLLTSCVAPPRIEMPPVEYRSGSWIKGEPRYEYVDDPHNVCSKWGNVPANWVIYACYIPIMNTIVLPHDDGSKRWDDLKLHEEGHARGWTHDE